MPSKRHGRIILIAQYHLRNPKKKKRQKQGAFYGRPFSYTENFAGEGQRADLTLNFLSEMSSWISDLTQNLSGVSQACVTWRTQGSTSCR